MTAPAPKAPPTPAAPGGEGQIPAPSVCPECKYSLAGLPPLGRAHPCPECGFPASRFAPPESWLRHADPAWLRRVVLGVRLSLFSQWYLAAFVLAVIALIVISAVLESVSGFTIFGANSGWPVGVGLWAAIGVGVASHAVGCVLMSAVPGPGGPPDGMSRKFARWCGAAFAPSCAFTVFAWPVLVGNLSRWAVFAVTLAMLLNAACYLAAEPVWLRRLEWRTEGWRLDSPARYRPARRTLLWMVGLAALMHAEAIGLLGGDPSSSEHTTNPARLWFAFMLIAFVVTARVVTKPALQALRAEARASARP